MTPMWYCGGCNACWKSHVLEVNQKFLSCSAVRLKYPEATQIRTTEGESKSVVS